MSGKLACGFGENESRTSSRIEGKLWKITLLITISSLNIFCTIIRQNDEDTQHEVILV